MNKYKLETGDCLEVLKNISDDYFDACISDPPYGMNMEEWDKDVPPVEIWQEVYRTLKPGAFCLSFCSPQLYHRLATNIEDAEFQIIDQIMWMTTTKMAVGNRFKPAHEPIAVAQKPFKGTVENNVEEWGTGKVDTENTKVPWDKKPPTGWVADGHSRRTFGKDGKTTGSGKEHGTVNANPNGRHPMNIIGEVLSEHQKYFYAPRATREERGDYNDHPTPKPINLMRYLVRGFSPEGGLVLDPFMGSGSTGIGALDEYRKFYGIDLSEHYVEIAERRLKERKALPEGLFFYDDSQKYKKPEDNIFD